MKILDILCTTTENGLRHCWRHLCEHAEVFRNWTDSKKH